MSSSTQSIEEQRRFWQEHLTKWSQSAQKVPAYCRTAGVCPKQFTAWRQRLRREGWQPPVGQAATLIPLEVRPRPEASNSSPITIRLASGVGIEVSAGFDAPTLQAVLQALGEGDVRA